MQGTFPGFKAKKTAPPPKKGSIYLLKFSGKKGVSWGKRFDFPPAHFNIGFNLFS
jgi:hypothetical protein